MEKPITTIEDLARLIQNTMASKEDIQGLAGKEDIKKVEEDMQELRDEMNERFEPVDARLDHLDARVGRIEADIHELRGEMVYRHEFEDALARVKYLEKKLGIESGV
jgi:predicted  nucleic acid-binding Zn-ribbon protein